ncbi:MAG: hypothetical protein KME17_23895 [Cyanosarcina radialis HA8281-LM2]|nr:hypothetical protein [Cyanosarcina radialis HA8281-LM2]
MVVAILALNISSSGGLLKAFNQVLAMPSGAVEITNEEINRHLLIARIKGRNALTQESIDGNYEIVKSLTDTDLLVRDGQGKLYRAGSSQECQLATNSVQTSRGRNISPRSLTIHLESEDIASALAKIPPASRTYVSGGLTLEDAEDLILPARPEQFNSITLQPTGGGIVVARLESASPAELSSTLGDYSATGSLIVRLIDLK